MPQPYLSRPSGTPDEKCMVYPLSPAGGAEAYMLYASASGENKWKQLYDKITAEADALKAARGVYVFVTVADEREETPVTPLPEGEFGIVEFNWKINEWIGKNAAFEYALENYKIISDKNLGDTAIVQITALPMHLGQWVDENN